MSDDEKPATIVIRVPYAGLSEDELTDRIESALLESVSTIAESVLRARHRGHGQGDESGPYDPDCPCRATDQQAECATAGCGFCSAAEDKA